MFVKINRKLLDSFCFANPNHLKLWVWCLLKANYKQTYIPLKVGKGIRTIKIERGQLLYGRSKAEDELNMSGSTIERYLNQFQELNQISVQVNSLYSVITICNYDSYQSKTNNNEQAMNSLWSGNEQAMNNEWTMNEQSMNTHKEYKEDKEYKEYMSVLLGEEEILKIKIKSEETMVVKEMEAIWKKYNQTYPTSIEEDFHALLNIAYFIAEAKGYKKSEVIEFKKFNVLVVWENVVKFISSKATQYLKSLTLDGLANKKNWQKVCNEMRIHTEALENERNGTSKARGSIEIQKTTNTTTNSLEGEELAKRIQKYS
jgi:hypothetical protein